jgi:hypothetical protein
MTRLCPLKWSLSFAANRVARAALALLFALSLTASLAADPPQPLALTCDLNSDGVADVLTAAENQFTVTNGLTGTQLVHFQGEAPGDGFALVALVIPDANGDGEPELLVAAPNAFAGAGAVYLFQSPWVSPCSDLVSAARCEACCINYALGCCERGEWACSDQLCPGGPFIPQEPRP